MARYGMLECGKNYGNTMNKTCDICNCIDDENHRLNSCMRWKDTNLYNSIEKEDFNDIYSSDIPTLRKIMPVLGKVWNTKHSHGAMNNK